MNLASRSLETSASGIALNTRLRGWMPPLDGIRGLAILMVMLFHFKGDLDSGSVPQHVLKWFSEFGKTGVDLFFVLSGFLITGILLDSRDAENRFSAFYMRRILRIFPIYYLSLIVVFLIVPAVFPNDPVRLRPASERTLFLTYLQNWQGDVQPPWPRLLVHYWSLAVEEQFYLVWPLVVFWAAPKRLLRIIVAACGFSLALRIAFLLLPVPPDIYYRNTFARMDTLLIGAACAVLLRNESVVQHLRRYTAWLWFMPVALMFVWRSPFSMSAFRVALEKTIGFTAIAVCYAGLLIAVVLTMGSKSMLQQFFASRIMILIGKYSYAAYIWHLLVAQLVRKVEAGVLHVSPPAMVNILIMMTATLAASRCSYVLAERPFLALKRYFEPRRMESGVFTNNIEHEKANLGRD